MRILYHITGAITFVNEIPWVVEPIYLAQVLSSLSWYSHVLYRLIFFRVHKYTLQHAHTFSDVAHIFSSIVNYLIVFVFVSGALCG